MYRIEVIYPNVAEAHDTCFAGRASDALKLIPELLAEHHGCERIILWLNTTRLFAVDGQGNAVDD